MKVRNQQGRVVEGDEIRITESQEQWNHYHLEDGTVLRLKPVLVRVVKIRGEYSPDGSPIYLVESKSVVGSTSPDALKHFDSVEEGNDASANE